MSKSMMKNPDAPHIDFNFMKGIITNIRDDIKDNPAWLACNIDMCCHRKTQFMFAEWKRPNEMLQKGQQYLLEALSANPNHHVFVVDGWSDKNGHEITQITRWVKKERFVQGHSKDDLLELIRKFYIHAEDLASPNNTQPVF